MKERKTQRAGTEGMLLEFGCTQKSDLQGSVQILTRRLEKVTSKSNTQTQHCGSWSYNMKDGNWPHSPWVFLHWENWPFTQASFYVWGNHSGKFTVDRAHWRSSKPGLGARELNFTKGFCARHCDEHSMCNISVLATNLWRRDAPYPHFTVEVSKAEKLTVPRVIYSKYVGQLGLEHHYFTNKVYMWSQTELRIWYIPLY